MYSYKNKAKVHFSTLYVLIAPLVVRKDCKNFAGGLQAKKLRTTVLNKKT